VAVDEVGRPQILELLANFDAVDHIILGFRKREDTLSTKEGF
jgi:hypothetical protein